MNYDLDSSHRPNWLIWIVYYFATGILPSPTSDFCALLLDYKNSISQTISHISKELLGNNTLCMPVLNLTLQTASAVVCVQVYQSCWSGRLTPLVTNACTNRHVVQNQKFLPSELQNKSPFISTATKSPLSSCHWGTRTFECLIPVRKGTIYIHPISSPKSHSYCSNSSLPLYS